jgi:hypothetical protein
MKSLHRLIPFLSFCNCQLNSIPLLPSLYPGRLTSRNSTLHSMLLQIFSTTEHFLISTFHGPRRKHSLAMIALLFTMCVQGYFLLSRCLAIGIHATIYKDSNLYFLFSTADRIRKLQTVLKKVALCRCFNSVWRRKKSSFLISS